MELIELGKAVRLHGFLGALKIATKFDKDFDIKKIKSLFDEKGNELKTKRVFLTNDGIVAEMENVDLERAKTFIGKMFLIERSLVEGKILFEDLKGSTVFLDNETEIGKIEDVQDYGTAEVISVKTKNGKELMFPSVPKIIKSFDYKTKILILDSKIFGEVSTYED